jgi:hypothetical protein
VNVASLFEILKAPLILGASVSADHLTESPGKVLAKRFTSAAEIKVIARGGTSGKEVLKLVKDADFLDRTCVIGIDLFFWDATLKNAHASLLALHTLVNRVVSLGIPLILGDVPELMPHRQPHARKLSDEMKRLASLHPNVIVVPLEKMLEKIIEDEHLLYQNRKYTLFELVPDGLHIGKVAASFLADEIQKLLEK